MNSTDASSRERLVALAAGLGVSRAEAAALGLLALFGALALGVVWWAQGPSASREASGSTGLPHAEGESPDEVSGPGIVVERSEGAVVVHVAGLVRAPGVHRLPAGSRVADALDAAGGTLADAWLDALNLARPLADGEQLLVPARPPAGDGGGAGLGDGTAAGAGAGEGGTGNGAVVPGGIRPDGSVDLNRASSVELQTLPGIGPVMAERIVEHREAQGPFTAVGQLRDVRGIGEKTFQSLVDLVSV